MTRGQFALALKLAIAFALIAAWLIMVYARPMLVEVPE